MLAVVAFVLLIEFIRGGGAFSGKRSTKEKTNKEQKNISPSSDSIKKPTAADSIAKLYSPMVFRDAQLKYPRVKTAYQDKGDSVRALYRKYELDENSLNLYIRAFKKEELIEVWAKDKKKAAFVLLKTYKFCKSSGKLGPKRKKGDNQIPEGFYHIDRFNHQSTFFLSLGLNYPNRSDKILGDTTGLGSDIFIHGDCVTIGCIPITDDKIKELYILAVDAKAGGQKKIPVSIFPTKLTNENFKALQKEFANNKPLLQFWKGLKDGYQAFEQCRKLPNIIITAKGDYICKPDCG